MPTIVRPHEIEDPVDPDEEDFEYARLFKVTSVEGTEEFDSPDAACEALLDLIEQQFWEWFANPARTRRFKPRVKVYEVW